MPLAVRSCHCWKSEGLLLLHALKMCVPCHGANHKVWMVSDLFSSWLTKLDKQFMCQGRDVALVIGNCPAHPNIQSTLKATKLIFLPPNTTSKLQPCDQGIIHWKLITENIRLFNYLLPLKTFRLLYWTLSIWSGWHGIMFHHKQFGIVSVIVVSSYLNWILPHPPLPPHLLLKQNMEQHF